MCAAAVKEAGKNKTYSQFEVRDVAWVERYGADALDVAMLRHFAKEFNAKLDPGKDMLDAPKAIAKLRKALKRTKEVRHLIPGVV